LCRQLAFFHDFASGSLDAEADGFSVGGGSTLDVPDFFAVVDSAQPSFASASNGDLPLNLMKTAIGIFLQLPATWGIPSLPSRTMTHVRRDKYSWQIIRRPLGRIGNDASVVTVTQQRQQPQRFLTSDERKLMCFVFLLMG
jgi:hypothetical protein